MEALLHMTVIHLLQTGSTTEGACPKAAVTARIHVKCSSFWLVGVLLLLHLSICVL